MDSDTEAYGNLSDGESFDAEKWAQRFDRAPTRDARLRYLDLADVFLAQIEAEAGAKAVEDFTTWTFGAQLFALTVLSQAFEVQGASVPAMRAEIASLKKDLEAEREKRSAEHDLDHD